MARADTYQISKQGQEVTLELGFRAQDWDEIVMALDRRADAAEDAEEFVAAFLWSQIAEYARVRKIQDAEHRARQQAHKDNPRRKPERGNPGQGSGASRARKKGVRK